MEFPHINYELFKNLLDTINYGILKYSSVGTLLYANRYAREVLCLQDHLSARNTSGSMEIYANERIDSLENFPVSINPAIKRKVTHCSFRLKDSEKIFSLEMITEEDLTFTVTLCDTSRYQQAELPFPGLLKYIRTLNEAAGTEYTPEVIRDAILQQEPKGAYMKSKANFGEVLDHVHLAGIMLDPRGNITYANDFILLLTGWKRDEVIGKNGFELFLHPKNKETLYKRFESMISNHNLPPHTVNQIMTKSGTLKTISWSNTLLNDAKGNIASLISIGEDITERNHAEALLLESEKNYRAVFDCSPIAIAWLNIQGKIISANDAWVNLLGYNYQELAEMTLADFAHPDDAATYLGLYAKLTTGKIDQYQLQKRYFHKEGHTVWGNLNVSIVRDEKSRIRYVLAMVKDITELKLKETEKREAEEALIRTNQQLNNIIKSVPGVVFRCKNTPAFDIEFISEQIFELSGYRPEEFFPKGNIKLSDIIHEADLESVYNAVKKKDYEISYRIRTRDNREKWIWEKGTVVGGDESYIEGILADIDDKVKMEEQLISATLQAEDRERSRISKEIHDGVQQTLISAMLSFQALEKHIKKLDPSQQKHFSDGYELLKKGIGETRSVAYSIMPKSIHDFGLVKTIEGWLSHLNKTYTTLFHFYNNLEDIRLNEKIELSLYKICQEGVENILKYSQSEEAVIQLMKYDKIALLSIEDYGVGFDMEKIDPFTSGFGISAMKSRASSILGRFTIHSRPGKGTSILIEIPLY